MDFFRVCGKEGERHFNVNSLVVTNVPLWYGMLIVCEAVLTGYGGREYLQILCTFCSVSYEANIALKIVQSH